MIGSGFGSLPGKFLLIGRRGHVGHFLKDNRFTHLDNLGDFHGFDDGVCLSFRRFSRKFRGALIG